VRSSKVRVALFRSAAGFPNDDSLAIRNQEVNIAPQSLSEQVVFAGLPLGVYAMSLFHDENMNQKLDNFDEAKFQLDKTEHSLEINLIY
jgi:uncharacterized protein (DUF2141 family)